MRPIVISLIVLLMATTSLVAGATYAVSVGSAAPEKLHVEATFTLESEIISLAITRSATLANGQADLIRELQITSGDQTVSWEAIPDGDWKLDGVKAGDIVTVNYDILLEHDQHEWGPGIDEVSYRTDDGVFFTGRSLFILPGFESAADIIVSFDLPDGWRASTPWQSTGDGFVAHGIMDLALNCMFLGKHIEETVRLDEFEFVMAFGSDLKASKQLFVDSMTPLLPAFVETFGGLPTRTRYLMVVNRGDRSDGGAFADSYSMLIKGPVDKTSAVIWGHGVAHELLHFWNGHTIMPAATHDSEWFKEGFTDYLTILHRSRAGLDTQQNTIRKIENCLRRYTVARMLMGQSDSMRDAGADKHNKRFLVYAGGSLVAFVLDVQIREATNNKKSLDTMMAAMYDEFGTPDSRYVYEDIVRVASEVSGKDLSGFFDRYVSGSDFLDATPFIETAGLRLDQSIDEFYITLADAPSKQQAAIRKGMLGW